MRARKPRVLTICVGGTVRSVGLKDYLNGRCHCNAIAISAAWQDYDTTLMMCNWADVIVPVEPREHLGEEAGSWVAKACHESRIWHPDHDEQRVVVPIGKDIWGNARDPKLVTKIGEVVGPLLERLGVRAAK